MSAPHPVHGWIDEHINDGPPTSGRRRVLPHDLIAEASFLGGIMLYCDRLRGQRPRNAILKAFPELEVDDFYDHKHKVVFQAMRNLDTRSVVIDVATLEHEIGKMGKLEVIGGVAFLGELSLRVPTADNTSDYAAIVRDKHQVRKVMLELGEITEQGYDDPEDAAAYCERALARIAELVGKRARRPVGRTFDDCVDEVYRRKEEPWSDIRIGSTIIATCRSGSFVPLIAPSGAGKSSLILQMLIEHAQKGGIALYLTHELDGDEAAARIIGQHASFSWSAALRGEVPRALVPRIPRLRILERDSATLENMATVVAELRAAYPDLPALVAVDYLQATPAPPGKERGHVANISTSLRIAAKVNRVVLIGVSQASTANAAKLTDGELLGIDGAATGAETAQIHRDAYVILTLGDRRVIDPASVAWKLSTAKNRLGEADVVHEIHYEGRVGTWRIVSGPMSAADARQAKDAEASSKKREERKRAIVALVEASDQPVSKKFIGNNSTGRGDLIADVVKELIRDGALVFTDQRRGGAPLLWTPSRVSAEASQ